MSQRKSNVLTIQIIAGIGVYVTAADFGLISLAVPTIANHFDADLPTVQWVMAIHVLATAALLLPAGTAGDIVSRKGVFLAGLVLFAMGAFASGFAGDLTVLLIARTIQGIGGGIITGAGWALSVNAVSAEDRGRTLGLLTGTIASGMISGPVFGGILVDGLGWRSVFFFTAIISVIGIVLAYFRLQLPRVEPSHSGRSGLDWSGMFLASLAIVTAIVMLTSGPRAGWTSPLVIGSSITAALALIALIAVELRHPSPMIDMRLFRNRAFTLGSMGMFLTFSTLAITPVMLPFYLQGVLNYSPRLAGLILAPTMLMLGLFGPIGGRIADKFGSRWPTTVGAGCMALAYIIFSRLDVGTSLALIIVPLMLQGVGNGLFGPANNSGIISSVEPGRMGVATSFVNLARAGGLNVGIAVATIVVTMGITGMGVEPDIGVFREEGAIPDPRLVSGFVTGLSHAYIVAVGVVLLAGVTVLRGMPSRDRSSLVTRQRRR